MKRILNAGVLAGATLLASGFALPAYAQKPGINLNTSTPGARANAMGGAFFGVADDATAAVTNPAGLVSLTKPQVYAEFTSKDFEPFTGDPSLRLNSLSFLSFSAPVNSRVAVGLSRNQFLNYDDRVIQVTGDSIGGSISAVLNPTFRVGVTVSGERVQQTNFCEPDCTSWGLGVVLGGLWRPNDQVSVGAMVGTGSSHDTQGVNSPARAGGGVAYRPSARLLVAADLVWVNASDIIPNSGLSDISELHAGGEYLLVGGMNQLFVRAGAYAGSKKENANVPSVSSIGASVGIGYTVGQQFQTDLAYVTSSKEVILSGAFRFK